MITENKCHFSLSKHEYTYFLNAVEDHCNDFTFSPHRGRNCMLLGKFQG